MSFVTEYLERRGVGYEVAEHPRAVTSMAEARALGITADEVVKTVVLITDRGLALVVVPASRRLDLRLAREAVGDHAARLASEDELQRSDGLAQRTERPVPRRPNRWDATAWRRSARWSARRAFCWLSLMRQYRSSAASNARSAATLSGWASRLAAASRCAVACRSTSRSTAAQRWRRSSSLVVHTLESRYPGEMRPHHPPRVRISQRCATQSNSTRAPKSSASHPTAIRAGVWSPKT